jgi:hypothetical protein
MLKVIEIYLEKVPQQSNGGSAQQEETKVEPKENSGKNKETQASAAKGKDIAVQLEND